MNMLNENEVISASLLKSSDHILQQKEVKLIAIGGGKGGVGKTFFAVGLGLSLVNLKKKIVLVDADFHSPSLNNFLNINSPRKSLKDLFLASSNDINAIVEETSYPNLKLISGTSGILGMSELCYEKHNNLIEKFRELDADYIILDLGSGNNPETINLFCTADEGMIITNPDPMSIQETFSFLKMCQFQILKNYFKLYPNIIDFIRETFETYNYSKYKSLKKLLQDKSRTNSNRKLKHVKPKLILNMVSNEKDALDGYALQLVSEDLLGVELDYVGDIYFDQNIRQSINQGKLLHLANNSKISEISEKLISNGSSRGFWCHKGIRSRNLDFNSEDIICSVRCSLWDNCSFQRGGYPCKIKYIGFISSQ